MLCQHVDYTALRGRVWTPQSRRLPVASIASYRVQSLKDISFGLHYIESARVALRSSRVMLRRLHAQQYVSESVRGVVLSRAAGSSRLCRIAQRLTHGLSHVQRWAYWHY